MAIPAQITPAQAARALDQIKALLAEPAGPTTEEVKRIEDAVAELKADREWTRSLLLAAIPDEPCPVQLFKPWCSYEQLRKWSLDGQEPKVEWELINDRRMMRPSKFFALLKARGKGAA